MRQQIKKLKRIKPYKADTPLNTIIKIRNILNQCGIFTIESHYQVKNVDLFSCRVEIEDEDLGKKKVGTNGKGMERLYSLASAYAEFMERLQNNYFFNFQRFASKSFLSKLNDGNSYLAMLKKRDLILDYEIAPDEKYFSLDELLIHCPKILKYLFRKKNDDELLSFLKNSLNVDYLTCVPFFCVNDKSIHYIPKRELESICGSTGLCAGNTKEEAIIQGICEIFERYAIKKIYGDKITPPTIPHDFFKHLLVYKKINKIESTYNCSVIIKDCSLGMGLPVIGVLIIDKTHNKYCFKLGADPSPITSLERCITEIFQGGDYSYKVKHGFREINLSDDGMDLRNQKDNKKFIKEYFNTVYNGNGEWPNSIFLKEASYEFIKFANYGSISDKDDLKILLEILSRLKCELYIRDVSYLKFPSFQIYIPSMSETLNDTDEMIKANYYMRKNADILFHINNENTNKFNMFVESLATISDYDGVFNIINSFLPNSSKDLKDLSHDIFLMALFFRVNDLNSSLKYLNNFLNKLSNEEKLDHLYYYCIRDYLKLRLKGIEINDIKEILFPIYGEDINSVINGFGNPKEIFKEYALPSCFNCEKCQMNIDCKYFNYLQYAKRLQEIYKENIIDQSCLHEVFRGC